MRRSVWLVSLCVVVCVTVAPAMPQAAREATIEPETRARLVLQTRDPRLEACSVRNRKVGLRPVPHRAARARRMRRHETAPGSR